MHLEKAEVNGWIEEQHGQTTSPLHRQEEHMASAGDFEGTRPNNSACSAAVPQQQRDAVRAERGCGGLSPAAASLAFSLPPSQPPDIQF